MRLLGDGVGWAKYLISTTSHTLVFLFISAIRLVLHLVGKRASITFHVLLEISWGLVCIHFNLARHLVYSIHLTICTALRHVIGINIAL